MTDADDVSAHDARLIALGRVAESAAIMETLLRVVVSGLIGSPRAVIVVSGQNVSWLIETALAIVKHNDEARAPTLGKPEDLAAFDAALRLCKVANRQRNDALHGTWMDDGRQIVSKYRQPYLMQTRPAIDLAQLSQDLDEAITALANASIRITGALPRPTQTAEDPTV